MGSLERRIQQLEELWGMDEAPGVRDIRTEEKRAEIRARLQRIISEEEELDPRRQRAIEDFLESWRSRRRREGGA